jgi:hypothetical protein
MTAAWIPCRGNEHTYKSARAARSNFIYRDGHPPPEARQMQCGMQSRRSFHSRSAHRSGVKAPTAFIFPSFVPSFLPTCASSLGPPPLTPAVRPALRQVCRGERAAAGRD